MIRMTMIKFDYNHMKESWLQEKCSEIGQINVNLFISLSSVFFLMVRCASKLLTEISETIDINLMI